MYDYKCLFLSRLEGTEDKFRNRESRPEDLQVIADLREMVCERESLVKKLVVSLSYCGRAIRLLVLFVILHVVCYKVFLFSPQAIQYSCSDESQYQFDFVSAQNSVWLCLFCSRMTRSFISWSWWIESLASTKCSTPILMLGS